MMNKKLLLVPAAAGALALAAGSIAYACAPMLGVVEVTFGDNTTPCTSDAVPQTNTSGNCGIDLSVSRKIVATADGARANTAFHLWFLNDAARDQMSMDTCMSDIDAKHPDTKTASNPDGTGTGGSVTSDANGDIAATTRYIPSTIKHGLLWPEQSLLHTGPHNGTASLCFMDEDRDYPTQDVTVLITGGNP